MKYHIGRGVMQYKCLVGWKIPPVDGYVAVRLVLATEVYVVIDQNYLTGLAFTLGQIFAGSY